MSTKNVIPVVFATDIRYLFPTSVAIISMLEHAEKSTFYDINILMTDTLIEKNTEIFKYIKHYYPNCDIKCLPLNESLFKKAKVTTPHLSISAYYRLFISEILTDAERCIYMDGDVLVNTDLNELYEWNIEDNYMGAVKNFGAQIKTEENENKRKLYNLPSMDHYIYSGMLVMNLTQIRKDNLIVDFVRQMEKGLPSEDESVFNICCYGRIHFLPIKYNLLTRYHKAIDPLINSIYSEQELQEALESPAIIHFAGKNEKPWENLRCKESGTWWKYAAHLSHFPEYDHTLRLAKAWSEEIAWSTFRRIIRQDKNIAIFGFTDISKNLMLDLKKNGIDNIKCFCDNNSSKCGEFEGIPICSINDAMQAFDDLFVIIASQIYYKKIETQLEQLGIEKENIVKYNHKNASYYLSLDAKYYESELREIYMRENIDLSIFDEKGYAKILSDLRGTVMQEENKRLVNKYYMNLWIQGGGIWKLLIAADVLIRRMNEILKVQLQCKMIYLMLLEGGNHAAN